MKRSAKYCRHVRGQMFKLYGVCCTCGSINRPGPYFKRRMRAHLNGCKVRWRDRVYGIAGDCDDRGAFELTRVDTSEWSNYEQQHSR